MTLHPHRERALEAAVAGGDLDDVIRALGALSEAIAPALAWLVLLDIQLEDEGVAPTDREPYLLEGAAALTDTLTALESGDAEQQRHADLRMQRVFRRRYWPIKTDSPREGTDR